MKYIILELIKEVRRLRQQVHGPTVDVITLDTLEYHLRQMMNDKERGTEQEPSPKTTPKRNKGK
jgi:hypothetical protein